MMEQLTRTEKKINFFFFSFWTRSKHRKEVARNEIEPDKAGKKKHC